MSKLIDRGAVMIDYLERLGRADSYKAKYEALAAAVDNAPAVEAVGIVRCKDCKHRGIAFECPMRFAHWHGDDSDFTSDDGFCERGARMDMEVSGDV